MTRYLQYRGYYRTLRTLFLSLVSLVTLFLSMSTAYATAGRFEPNNCIKCHEDVYTQAISFNYQHSILKEQCTFCHVKQSPENEVKMILNFSTLQKEQIVHLEGFPGDHEYTADVLVTDEKGVKSLPKRVSMNKNKILSSSIKFANVKEISGVTVDEIKKGAFVTATITWNTNAYSSTELEYKIEGGRKSLFTSGEIFSKKHRAVLYGLKHKHVYKFKAISRDMNGNVIESREYFFDTSNNMRKSTKDQYQPPAIVRLQAFTLEGKSGVFLKVFANKPSELTIKLIELNQVNARHGFGLLDDRYSRIDICIKCHPRGTSHPVGVKAEGTKIRTPVELPTIEDGIITCVTCHNPHGGDNPFYARFDRNKDICILCHVGGY